jgi:hypothetical protein
MPFRPAGRIDRRATAEARLARTASLGRPAACHVHWLGFGQGDDHALKQGAGVRHGVIPGICELANFDEDPGHTQQQLRVLYVAMTRALRLLEISHHGESSAVEQIRSVVKGVSRRLAT